MGKDGVKDLRGHGHESESNKFFSINGLKHFSVLLLHFVVPLGRFSFPVLLFISFCLEASRFMKVLEESTVTASQTVAIINEILFFLQIKFGKPHEGCQTDASNNFEFPGHHKTWMKIQQ